MILLYISAAILVFAFVLLIFAGFFFFHTAIVKSEDDPRDYYDRLSGKLVGTDREYLLRETLEGRRFFREEKYELCELTSYDGIKLRARLFEKEGAGVTVIMFHGHRSAPYIDFPVQMKRFFNMGYNVLAPSQRASNESDGKYICFGVKERFDVADWCKFVTERYGEDHRIILFGLSMGASSVLMASESETVKKSVSGIIADCGYTTAMAEFKYIIRYEYGLRPFPFVNAADIVSKFVAGWGFNDASTVSAVKNTTVPILFIHGDGDTYVPHSFTLDNYEACASRRELLIVDGASHGTSFYRSPIVYEAKVKEFLRSVL